MTKREEHVWHAVAAGIIIVAFLLALWLASS